MDRGFNLNSKRYNKWIKILTNGCVLISFDAKFDHRTCRHEEELMASIWHPDKFEKIPKKIIKNSLLNEKYYHQKQFYFESI